MLSLEFVLFRVNSWIVFILTKEQSTDSLETS